MAEEHIDMGYSSMEAQPKSWFGRNPMRFGVGMFALGAVGTVLVVMCLPGATPDNNGDKSVKLSTGQCSATCTECVDAGVSFNEECLSSTPPIGCNALGKDCCQLCEQNNPVGGPYTATCATCDGTAASPVTDVTTAAPVAAATDPDSNMKKLEFYVYRAVESSFYGLDNTNAASAGGVLRYLQTEVIPKQLTPGCRRKYGITKVKRLKVTMMNPTTVYNERHGQFGPFRQFDSRQCTFGGSGEACQKGTYDKYGYVVGCQNQAADRWTSYPESIWYSFPGQCPAETYYSKSAACKAQYPGGQCSDPTGTTTCTWTYEDAGEVELDGLVGISPDYHTWCEEGNVEWDQDTQTGIEFWMSPHDEGKNQERIEKLEAAFKARYPQFDHLDYPACDGF